MDLIYAQRSVILSCLFAFLASISRAATSSCETPDFNTVNATGSVGFEGFPSPDSYKNHTWTISTAITQTQDFAANTSITEQTYWLKTDPVIETNLTDLPYWGCLILLEG